MKYEPLVSVIMSTRNRRSMVATAISSVLNQTYRNFEFIIVDGASTDGTGDVVKSFTDERIRYFYETDDSSHKNCMRIAVEQSRGDLIALQDDDDEWYPEKLEKQVTVFVESDSSLGVVYCWEQIYDWSNKSILKETNQSLRGDVYLSLLEAPGYGGGSLMMVRREVFKEFPFGERITALPSDYLWCLRVSQKYKFDYVPEVLSRTNVNHNYGRLTNLACGGFSYKHAIELTETILKMFEADYDKHPSKRRYHYRSLINNSIKTKDVNRFVRYYIKAFPLLKGNFRYYGYPIRLLTTMIGIK